MPEWQPIETAPKDGTLIVVVGNMPSDPPMFYQRACVSWWSERAEDTPAYVERGWIFMAPGYADRFIPTYWMPLPDPPAGTEG